jgi:hypothetical protein
VTAKKPVLTLTQERYDRLVHELSYPEMDERGMLTERGLQDVGAYTILVFGRAQGLIRVKEKATVG